MKITIITSAYNAEKTIGQTIQSVLGQSFAEFEYIVVDHGSTDSTGSIIEAFAQKDCRIRVIKIQSNTGKIGVAINLGMKNAKGRYISFLDADDIYHPDFLQVMYENITQNECDVCVCGSSRMDGDMQEFLIDTIKGDQLFLCEEDYKKLPRLIIDAPTRYFTVWWNKLYDAAYLRANALLMPENTLVHGDALFNLRLLELKPKMYCSDYVGVGWRQTKGSVSFGTYKGEYCDEIMAVCSRYFGLFDLYSAQENEVALLANKMLLTIATPKRLKSYEKMDEELKKWNDCPIYKQMKYLCANE